MDKTPDWTKIAWGLESVRCSIVHKGPCYGDAVQNFLRVFKWAFKMYFPLFLGSSLMKYKKAIANPIGTALTILKLAARASCLLATIIGLSKISRCIYIGATHNLTKSIGVIAAAFGTFPAIFIEPKERIAELTQYIVPRFLDSAWKMLRRRGLVVSLPGAHAIMFSLFMAATSYCHSFEKESMKPMIQWLATKFLGDN